jgi:hypothetical protein
MATIPTTERATDGSLSDGICFCRLCKGLVLCYLACLAIPLILLTGVLAVALAAFFG